MRDTDYEPHREPSKSQRKRDLDELKQLGRDLLDFGEDELRALPLPESLLDALLAAQAIRAHGALKRQLQYVGKLLRDVDAAPLRAAIEDRARQHELHTREFHQLEELRDRLIVEGDAALAAVMARFPHADRQHLRKLERQARSEHEQHQPPRAVRLLFRYLRELQEEPPD